MTTPSTRRSLTVVALLLSVFMGALEMTVVSAAMPTIIGDLGGVQLYSWVFTAYMLASTVTVPLYGKLADLYGRKPVMLFGLAIFLAGSAGAGLAAGLPSLIVFRALQGLGAGAMQPIALTIIGDLFDIQERAKIQGWFSAVWGTAGILGPIVGGALVEWLSWRWVFFINLPFGVAAAAVLVVALHERVERHRVRLDLAGAAVLSAAVLLVLAAGHGGRFAAPALGAAVALGALFVWIERRAAEPLLPLELFDKKVIAIASAAGALVGAATISAVTYVPLFVQGVLGGSAAQVAGSLTPLAVGWPLASTVTGRLLPTRGARPMVRLGLALAAMGTLAMALLLKPGVPLALTWAAMGVLGVGLGFANTSLLVAVQSSVEWRQRGVATASTMFFRTIGGTLAVGLLGGVLAASLARTGVPSHAADRLLGPERGRGLEASVIRELGAALDSALHVDFWMIFGIALAALAVGLLFPRDGLGAGLGVKTVGGRR